MPSHPYCALARTPTTRNIQAIDVEWNLGSAMRLSMAFQLQRLVRSGMTTR
jgi:hypothetical protein